MPQIFHPSMNTVSRVSIFGGLFFVVAVVGLAYTVRRSPYMTEAGVVHEQPVPFSHRHHVRDVGLDCRYCHTSVETSSSAGIPPTATCMNCHSQLWNDAPMLAKVRSSFREDKPLEWTRVHDLPDYVYFDHSIHVHKGIGCKTCHGEVNDMPLMWRESSLLMKWCLDCHRAPELHIRPRDEVFNMNWEPTEDFDPDKLLLEYHVDRKTNCSVCHR